MPDALKVALIICGVLYVLALDEAEGARLTTVAGNGEQAPVEVVNGE